MLARLRSEERRVGKEGVSGRAAGFSSRRRHTRYIGDWSSDVCSSDLDRSIAVLPFQNLSDEKENAYFADGVQDDLLTNLSKIGDLKVISRTSVMPYRATQSNAREIEIGRASCRERGREWAGGWFFKQKTAYEIHR